MLNVCHCYTSHQVLATASKPHKYLPLSIHPPAPVSSIHPTDSNKPKPSPSHQHQPTSTSSTTHQTGKERKQWEDTLRGQCHLCRLHRWQMKVRHWCSDALAGCLAVVLFPRCFRYQWSQHYRSHRHHQWQWEVNNIIIIFLIPSTRDFYISITPREAGAY